MPSIAPVWLLTAGLAVAREWRRRHLRRELETLLQLQGALMDPVPGD
jgi:hypothetical protein